MTYRLCTGEVSKLKLNNFLPCHGYADENSKYLVTWKEVGLRIHQKFCEAVRLEQGIEERVVFEQLQMKSLSQGSLP